MHRLVVALTTFLTLVGAVVVAGYLFIFAAQSDRAAQAVPADASVYATVYLQPSTGQKLNLAALLGRVPGFEDSASLDQKIHEITARLLGEAGLDYEDDIRPWLGNQLSIAARPNGIDPTSAEMLVVVGVKPEADAAAAVERIAQDLSLQATAEDRDGTQLMVADGTSWALLDDLLLVGSSAEIVRAGLDAATDRSPSLADSPRFDRAMDQLPADHLAAVYLDLEALSGESGLGDQMGGYSTASLALLVEPTGLRMAGTAPFDVDAAPAPAREAFALASEPSALAEWMPATTQLEAVVFGLSQTLQAAEEQLGAQDTTGDIAAAINQLRALAALGLGISIDQDLLPLFDRETGVALTGLDTLQPGGLLLLRPSDADAAAASLDRMRDAVRDRGAAIDETQVAGVTVTSVSLPDLGMLAYAVHDGVVMIGFSADDVAASLSARADGSSLAEDQRYRAAWELAGTRGGNELWLDAAAVVDAAGDSLGVTGEARDILLQVGSVAMTAPARNDHSEFHLVLTVR